MPNASRWIIQYSAIALAALFAGPLVSKLPVAQSFPVTLFDLNGPQSIRLAVEGAGVLILWLFAFHASRQMPDNGRGFSFLRRLLLPLTTLLLLIMTDKALRMAGLPLISRIGPQRYAIAYAAGLIATGIWLTAAWWLNRESLRRFFGHAPHQARREPTPAFDDDGQADHHMQKHDADDAHTSTVVLNKNGGPPATLGRYKILKELGRGAMGIVYLGKDPTIQRFVAIKTMSLDAIDDAKALQEAKARFFREAESTGRLSHPNIITIYDAGQEQDLGYIAMEVLEGTTLKHWSRKPNLLSLDKLIPIFSTVADALDYAHQQGVVHRDIKPANIMLTKDQVVKVMDFGIAKMASSSKTQTNAVLGTPTYMSPEQIAGKKVDGRSDIFSLGVVLFELLTGRPPFTADNVSALLFAITQSPHPSVTTFRSDVPPAVQTVLDRALQKDVVHRYRRASELAQELRACLRELAA